MERRRFSQTMASEWQTVFLSLTKCHGMHCSLPSRIETKVLKNCKTFSSRPRPRPRPRPNVQDQDQDFMIQDEDQDQDFHFCPRGASRPRPWSRGLHHCIRYNGPIDATGSPVLITDPSSLLSYLFVCLQAPHGRSHPNLTHVSDFWQ